MSEAEQKVLTTSIKAETLNTAVDVLLSLVAEARVHLGEDGLRVACVEPGNVAMHNPLELTPPAFERTPGGSFTVGTNLHRLSDAISKAAPEQAIDLSFVPEKRVLNISYANVDMDLACIDPDSIRSEPDVPDLELPNTFSVPASDWRDALDMAEMVSDHVEILSDPDAQEVTLRAEGDTDTMDYTFTADDLADPTKLNEEVAGFYSLEFSQDLASEVPGGTVTITYGDEFPYWLQYDFADGYGSVESMLAPRIRSD